MPVTRATSNTLLVTSMMVAMTVAGLSAAMPAIAEHFADVPNVSYLSRLVLVIPSLVIAVFSPIMGYLIDRFSRTRLLLIVVSVYGVVGGLGYFADHIETLIGLRFILGIAAAGVTTAVTTLSGDYFTGVERQRFLGVRTGLTNAVVVIINLCAGMLAAVSWRMPFLMYFSVLLLVPFVALLMPEPKTHHVHGSAPKPAAWPILFLAGLYVASFLHNTTFYLIPVQLPFYLHAIGIDDPRISGAALAVSSMGLAVGSILYAPLRRRVSGPELVFTVAFLLCATGMTVAALATNLLLITIGVSISGLGFGITFVHFALWVIDRVPVEIRGRAVGGLMTSTFLGHFASPFWSQIVADRFGIASIYVCGAVICLGLAFAYWLARKTPAEATVAAE